MANIISWPVRKINKILNTFFRKRHASQLDTELMTLIHEQAGLPDALEAAKVKAKFEFDQNIQFLEFKADERAVQLKHEINIVAFKLEFMTGRKFPRSIDDVQAERVRDVVKTLAEGDK